MLEYKLPDLGKDSKRFQNMNPDDLARMKDEIVSHLNTVIEAADEALAGMVYSYCDICAQSGHGYMSLPPDWGFLNGNIICDNCTKRWTKRFGEAPVLNREGELIYEQDSSIPEDSARWGQANFEFV